MAELTGLVDEATRKAAFVAAAAAEPDAAARAVASQAAIQEHFGRGLKAWTAQTGSDASRSDFTFREALVDAATLAAWETALTAAGYAVTRVNGSFVVGLSA